MTIGKELFDLIHQLDKEEKRAFKRYLNKYAEKKHLNVIHIFDILNKMKDFDKQAFNKLLVKKISKKKLSYEQFRLKRLLLHALIDFQQYKEELFIGDIINKIELSLKYKMTETVQDLLKIGHTYAKGKEATALRAIFLRYELSYKRMIEEEEETGVKQIKACVKELNEETEYAILKNKFYKAYRENIYLKNELSEEKIEELAKDPLFSDDSLANTFQKKNYLFYAKMLYAEFKEDFDLELVYAEKMIENYENASNEIPHILVYLSLNLSLIMSYNKNGLYGKGHQRIEYLKTLTERYVIENVNVIKKLETNCLYGRMMLLNGEKRYQEIYGEKEDIELFLKNQASEASFFDNPFFVYVLAKASFHVQSYEECIRWIHEFSEMAPKDKFQKGFLELKFLEFAVQYELDNSFLLDSILNAIYYLINKYQLQEEPYAYFYRALKLFNDGKVEKINHDKIVNNSVIDQTYLWLLVQPPIIQAIN